jgi:hypothetical protein
MAYPTSEENMAEIRLLTAVWQSVYRIKRFAGCRLFAGCPLVGSSACGTTSGQPAKSRHPAPYTDCETAVKAPFIAQEPHFGCSCLRF